MMSVRIPELDRQLAGPVKPGAPWRLKVPALQQNGMFLEQPV